MFVLSVVHLIFLAVSAVIAYQLGRRVLPKLLEKDHEAVDRLVDKINGAYTRAAAKTDAIHAQRLALKAKLSAALAPKAEPVSTTPKE